MPNDIPDRIFRKLQHVYPREFREEYADEMIVTFEERARDARARGRGTLIRFWVSVLMDVIATAAREHSDGWIQDINRAGRSLARNRSLTIVATLSLAIGIGATTTVFSVIDSVLLRSLPFPESDRLFVLTEESGHGISFFNYLEVQERSRTFRSLAAFRYPNTPPTYTGGEVPLVLDGSWRLPLFSTCSAQPRRLAASSLQKKIVPASRRLSSSATPSGHGKWEPTPPLSEPA